MLCYYVIIIIMFENEGSNEKAVLKQFFPAKLGIPAEEISTGITGTRRLGEKKDREW